MKGRNQNILMLVAVAALIFLLFNMNSKSDYSINEREYSMFAPTAVRSLAPLQPPWMVVCRRVPVSPPLFSLVR